MPLHHRHYFYTSDKSFIMIPNKLYVGFRLSCELSCEVLTVVCGMNCYEGW